MTDTARPRRGGGETRQPPAKTRRAKLAGSATTAPARPRRGVPSKSSTLVQADQVTIVGDGSRTRPLRAGDGISRGGMLVADEGALVSRDPRRVLNFVGAGIAARDRGDPGGAVDILVPGGIFLSQDGVEVPGGPHGVLDFAGDVRVEDVGNGGARVEVGGQTGAIGGGAAILTWAAIEVVRAPQTRYFFAPGFAENTSTDRPLPIIIPFDGTLRGLFARHGAIDTDGNPVTYTVLVNGVATSLVVAVATDVLGATGRNVDVSVSVAAGDLVLLAAQKDVTTTTSFLDVTVCLGFIAGR